MQRRRVQLSGVPIPQPEVARLYDNGPRQLPQRIPQPTNPTIPVRNRADPQPMRYRTVGSIVGDHLTKDLRLADIQLQGIEQNKWYSQGKCCLKCCKCCYRGCCCCCCCPPIGRLFEGCFKYI